MNSTECVLTDCARRRIDELWFFGVSTYEDVDEADDGEHDEVDDEADKVVRHVFSLLISLSLEKFGRFTFMVDKLLNGELLASRSFFRPDTCSCLISSLEDMAADRPLQFLFNFMRLDGLNFSNSLLILSCSISFDLNWRKKKTKALEKENFINKIMLNFNIILQRLIQLDHDRTAAGHFHFGH